MAVVLITGANRGIGLALAERYAKRGDEVIATARVPAAAVELQALAAKTATAGTGNVRLVELDVASQASAIELARQIAGLPIDLLINNAGQLNSYDGIDSDDHDEAAWQSVLMTNIAGPYFVTKALLPSLEAATMKKLAIVSSTMASSSKPHGGAYPYCASKAAATNLACNLAVELKSRGIAVGAYHPGWVRTEMGGPNASISTAESADGLIARFDALSLASTGVFENYRGEPMAF